MRAIPRRRRTAIAVVASVMALAGVLGGWLDRGADAAPSTERVEGADRYETAAAIARRLTHDARSAFLASGEDFPDALVAGAAANREGAAVLLTRRDALPAATAAALERSSPDEVVLVGGTRAISAEVERHVRRLTGARVARVAGADRFATAAALAGRSATASPLVYVATGRAFPDALAAGAARDPVLLVEPATVPAVTSDALRRLQPSSIRLVGGTASVSADVAQQLEQWAPVHRVAGPDRYATAAAVSGVAHPSGASSALLATGSDFPDALAAGAVGGSLLLVEPTCVPEPARLELVRGGAQTIWVIGGQGVVAPSVDRLLPCDWPLVGTNYSHHAVPDCSLQGTGILATYHHPGVRDTVRSQLQAMSDAGVESLRLILWHQSDASGEHWGVIPSAVGALAEPFRQNLISYLGDVVQSRFSRLTVSFAPMKTNDPNHAMWQPAKLEENWRFVADVRPLLLSHGPASIHVDLMNEGAPSPFQGAEVVDRVNGYLEQVYDRYVAAYGNDDVTVSVIASQGITDIEARLDNLVEALGDAAARPRRVEVHVAYDGAAALDNLHVVDRHLAERGWTQPVVIGETAYDDASVARAVLDFANESQRRVTEVLQWPLTSDKPCRGISVSPPYRVDAYLAALRP